MERTSTPSAGSAARVIATGIGGAYAFRVIRQLRCRAVNPDVQDPARNLMRWLQALAVVVAAIAVAQAVALFWSVGPVAIIIAVPVALLLVLLGLLGALYLWVHAEAERRKGGYMICEFHYPDAPRQVKASMRRIYRAGRSVQGGHAYTSGVFGWLEMDRLVYSAAERAVISSELSAAIRDLGTDAVGEDRAVLENARAQIKEISAYLAEVETALKQSAATAKNLSGRIAVPALRQAPQRVAAPKTAVRDDRRQHARSRLDEAQRRAQSFNDDDLYDVTERISAIEQGYREASEASRAIIAPDLGPGGRSEGSGQTDRPAPYSETGLSRDAARRSVSSSARKVQRLSTAAAKSALTKLGDRK